MKCELILSLFVNTEEVNSKKYQSVLSKYVQVFWNVFREVKIPELFQSLLRHIFNLCEEMGNIFTYIN